MAGRYGDNNPNTKYYDDYRNAYYNPDDEINRPGRNVNWKDIQQGFYLAAKKDEAIDTQLGTIDTEITELANADALMRADISTLNTITAEHSEEIRLLKLKDEAIDTQLGTIDTEITELANADALMRADISALNTITAEHTQQITAINTKDGEQDQAIASNTEDISDLDTRLGDAEQDIQNENQRNTAQDAGIADNSARITRLENSTDTRLDAVEQKNAEQDTRITGNTDDITRLEGNQSSIATRVTAIEGRLNEEAPTTRETPADTTQPRETIIGDADSNFSVSAIKTSAVTGMILADYANDEGVTFGVNSDASGDNIIVGNKSYKLGNYTPLFVTAQGLNYALENISANSYGGISPQSVTFTGLKPLTNYYPIAGVSGNHNLDSFVATIRLLNSLITSDSSGNATVNYAFMVYNTNNAVRTIEANSYTITVLLVEV